MDYDYDVIIIGAGPVGGYAARLLCERGLSVLMVEEHNEVGRPFQCAGLVTPSAMDAVKAYDTVVEDVDGALIHGHQERSSLSAEKANCVHTSFVGSALIKPLFNKGLKRVQILYWNHSQHPLRLRRME